MRKHRFPLFVIGLFAVFGIAVSRPAPSQAASGTILASGTTAAQVSAHLGAGALSGPDTAMVTDAAPVAGGYNVAVASIRVPATPVVDVPTTTTTTYPSAVRTTPTIASTPVQTVLLVSPPTTSTPAPGVWAELRQCESNDNYRDNTGNGYYGAYQFSQSTWNGLGYSGLPSDAAPAVQDQAAQKLQARSGWGQWPACSRKLGL
jgi:Transglycosylase-like domain